MKMWRLKYISRYLFNFSKLVNKNNVEKIRKGFNIYLGNIGIIFYSLFCMFEKNFSYIELELCWE